MWSRSSSSFPTALAGERRLPGTSEHPDSGGTGRPAAGWSRDIFSIISIWLSTGGLTLLAGMRPHTDGWAAGGDPAGGCLVASVLDKGQAATSDGGEWPQAAPQPSRGSRNTGPTRQKLSMGSCLSESGMRQGRGAALLHH